MLYNSGDAGARVMTIQLLYHVCYKTEWVEPVNDFQGDITCTCGVRSDNFIK